MSAARVLLITVAGPRGHVDIGVRSDATPGDLAEALGTVIGASPAATIIEHRSPPRPGVPEGGRALVGPGTPLAEVGVADGDLVLFRTANGGGGYSWPEVQTRPAEFGAGSPPPRAPALSSPPASLPPASWPPASAPLAPIPAAPIPADSTTAASTAAAPWAPPGGRSDASMSAGRAEDAVPRGTSSGPWDPAATRPDLRTAVPPAPDPAATRPDLRTAVPPAPDPAATRPDLRTAVPAAPDPAATRPDLRTAALPAVDPAITRPDVRRPAPREPGLPGRAPRDSGLPEPRRPEPDPTATRPDVRSPAPVETRSAGFDVWTPATGPDAWPTADPQPDAGQYPAQEGLISGPELSEPTAGRHARSQTPADEPQRQGWDVTQDWQAGVSRAPEQDQPWWHSSQEVNPDDWPG
jgi:hypothetical protein